MGVDVRLVEGVGPVIDEPVRTLADVERLRVPDPEEAFAPVLEAVRHRPRRAPPRSGGRRLLRRPVHGRRLPVEGKPSREFALTKSLMLGEPDVWHALLEKLAETFAGYVAAKARAGADVIQLFDSWVGALSPGALPRLRGAAFRADPAPPSTSRRSTSAPARRRSSRRWPRPAAT